MADKVYAGSVAITTPVWKNENNEVAERPKNYKDNTTLDMEDFYTLMAAQLKYQDVLNPESNTSEMMTSMVQMSMVNALSDLQTMTQTTYAASMMGKTVTIAETLNGKLKTFEGVVEGVSLYNGTPKLIVNGKEYEMSQVMQLGTKTPTEEPPKTEPDDEGGKDEVTDKDDTTEGGGVTDKDDTTENGGVTDKDDTTENGGVTDKDDTTEGGGVTDKDDTTENGGGQVEDTTNKDNPNKTGEQDDTGRTETGDDGSMKTETVENGEGGQA